MPLTPRQRGHWMDLPVLPTLRGRRSSFVESRELVAMMMAVTICTVVGLAYLTDKAHSLTTKLQDSKSTLVQVNEQLQAALNEVKGLCGLLPICAWCKDIRDERGAWEAMETYIGRHSRATFTHGLCPKCLDEQLQMLK